MHVQYNPRPDYDEKMNLFFANDMKTKIAAYGFITVPMENFPYSCAKRTNFYSVLVLR